MQQDRARHYTLLSVSAIIMERKKAHDVQVAKKPKLRKGTLLYFLAIFVLLMDLFPN